MNRKRGGNKDWKYGKRRFHDESGPSRNRDQDIDTDRPNRHPSHLRGRAIGLYYANLNKKRQENEQSGPARPIGTICLNEECRNKITTLLSQIEPKTSKSSTDNDYSYIQDSEFKNQFLNIISTTFEDKLNNTALRKALIRDESVDEKYFQIFSQKELSREYKQFLPIRKKLPSYDKREDIINLVNNNQVIVISGETGCGKTTQVAQFILDDYLTNKKGSICRIVCTQPRRISAISIAERVAQERGEKCGAESVGYHIRLEKELPRSTGSITFCTTGVLLKQMETDPYLSEISHLILDEIHERDIVSDFIITLVRRVIELRSDIKLILMSATLNAKEFCKYFNNCQCLEIPGFTHPVQSIYLEEILEKFEFTFKEDNYPPWRKHLNKKNEEKEYKEYIEPYIRDIFARRKISKRTYDALMNPKSEELNIDLVFELIKYISYNEPMGSILVFLPGLSDIAKLNTKMLKTNFFPEHKFLIIPLHSKLPSIQQRKVFDRPPTGVRKIIVATNIAETSITIDDIIYVIDCGKIKMTNYDVENDIESLKPEWVSWANAQQRKGRAGRVQPGICYHLFTKARQNCLKTYQLPEVQRSRLENIILTIKILQLGNAVDFLNRLMDPPHVTAVENGVKLLKHMNALDGEEKLTPLGYHLGKLPVNPRMGKMILLGAIFSCLDPITSIAASLDFKDAFCTPVDKNKQRIADEKKHELLDGWKSDHLLLAEALRQYEDAKFNGNEREFCWEYFLSRHTLELLRSMKDQFAQYLHEMKFLTNKNVKSEEWNKNSNNMSLIKAIVCASLYPNVALVRKITQKRRVIKTIENETVQLHPNSINSSMDNIFESPILVYHLKLKSTAIFLHDTTMVFPLPLVFFGDEIKISETDSNTIIALSNSLRFKCKEETAVLIKQLRKHMDLLLQYKISHPGIVNWLDENAEVSVLRAIMELITSEDLGELDFEDSD